LDLLTFSAEKAGEAPAHLRVLERANHHEWSLGPMVAFVKDDNDEECMKFIWQGVYYMNVKIMAFWGVTPHSSGHGN
jgi:hypothetical protein